MSWKDKYQREGASGKNLSNAKPKSGNGNRIKIGDVISIHTWKPKDWDSVRLIGPLHSYGFHNVVTYGKTDGKKYEFQKQCLNYNPETEERDLGNDCPYCDADYKFRATYFHNAIIRDLQDNEPRKPSPPTKSEAKSGFKSKDSASWTPVEVLRLPPSLVTQLINLAKLNKKGKGGDPVPVSDVENGRDISVMFDKDASGDGMYKVQLGSEVTPITDEEGDYLIWNLEDCIKPETEAEAEAEIARFKKACAEYGGEDSDDDDDTPARSKKDRSGKSGSKPSAKGKVNRDDDDDDSQEEDDDDTLPDEGDRVVVTDKDDEDEQLAVGTVASINTKKIVIETDDGDTETFFLSRVSVAQAPAKSKSSAKSKGKKVEDDDDATSEFEEGDAVRVLDSDDEDDELATGTIVRIDAKKVVVEDEDGETQTFKLTQVTLTKAKSTAKSKSKSKSKGKVKDGDDDDDEDAPEFDEGDKVVITDEDGDELATGTITSINAKKVVVEDDDDDEHTFKRSEVTISPAKKAKGKPAKGKKVEEDDDDDDDEPPAKSKSSAKSKGKVEDDDDDDEPPAKSKGKAAPKKGKRFSFDDDDE